MTNEERVLRAIERKNEGQSFYDYADMILWYYPLLSLPFLRELWKYAATPDEIKRTHKMQYADRALPREFV